jgi:hypothetical protein
MGEGERGPWKYTIFNYDRIIKTDPARICLRQSRSGRPCRESKGAARFNASSIIRINETGLTETSNESSGSIRPKIPIRGVQRDATRRDVTHSRCRKYSFQNAIGMRMRLAVSHLILMSI